MSPPSREQIVQLTEEETERKTMGLCTICGSGKNILRHHISYEHDVTVPLCASCHIRVHRDKSHRLYPIDYKPTNTMKSMSTQIPDDLYERLKDEVDDNRFSSLGEAIRYYLRRGMKEEEEEER